MRGELRQALRVAQRHPGFSTAVVASLGLGISTAVGLITMVDSAGRAKDTVSGLSRGRNFSVTWKRST